MKNSNVSENDNKSKLNSLYEQIIEHNKKYHQDDNPSIPDAEYDELVREAIEIEKNAYLRGLIGVISASVKYHSILFLGPYWTFKWLETFFEKKKIEVNNNIYKSFNTKLKNWIKITHYNNGYF